MGHTKEILLKRLIDTAVLLGNPIIVLSDRIDLTENTYAWLAVRAHEKKAGTGSIMVQLVPEMPSMEDTGTTFTAAINLASVMVDGQVPGLPGGYVDSVNNPPGAGLGVDFVKNWQTSQQGAQIRASRTDRQRGLL